MTETTNELRHRAQDLRLRADTLRHSDGSLTMRADFLHAHAADLEKRAGSAGTAETRETGEG
jgi:hypothetical protein